MEVVTSLSQGRTAAAQCGLFTHKSVPVIFEPPCANNKGSSEAYRNSKIVKSFIIYMKDIKFVIGIFLLKGSQHSLGFCSTGLYLASITVPQTMA